MTSDPKTMSCEEFQAQLSDLVGSGADVENHPHIKECDLCRQLYQELQTIADAARQLFPDQQPEDNLWERIESAIKKERQKRESPKPNESRLSSHGQWNLPIEPASPSGFSLGASLPSKADWTRVCCERAPRRNPAHARFESARQCAGTSSARRTSVHLIRQRGTARATRAPPLS